MFPDVVESPVDAPLEQGEGRFNRVDRELAAILQVASALARAMIDVAMGRLVAFVGFEFLVVDHGTFCLILHHAGSHLHDRLPKS